MKLGIDNIFVENKKGKLIGYLDRFTFLKYKSI